MESCDDEEVCLLQLKGAEGASSLWTETFASTGSIEVMRLKDEGGGCKGRIGKRGNFWLIERDATVKSCQEACLDHADCRFANLQKKGGSGKKWKCASFKKCKKVKTKEGYISFTKVKASTADSEGRIWTEDSNQELAAGLTPFKLTGAFVTESEASLVAKNSRSDRRCTQNLGYLHTSMQPYLTADNEFAVCENPSTPCCRYHGGCDSSTKCDNGDMYAAAGISVTKTRQLQGSQAETDTFASLLKAGSEGLAWPEFTAHAVGLQYCEAQRTRSLSSDFKKWLEGRPDLLLSLAATTYPVQGKIWENFEKLWHEFKSDMDNKPEFGSTAVGFSYMNRLDGVDTVVANFWHSAHGDGAMSEGHSQGGYGKGKLPVHGTTCSGYESRFPDRDPHPTARDRVKFQLEKNLPMYPWPLIPYGYYGPTRGCAWIVSNPSAKCPYTMNLFKWMNNKMSASSNPFCMQSGWHPLSIPRISQNGRVCGGCSYFSFAKASCAGKIAGRRPEPGHSADFIISASGSDNSRTFAGRTYSVSSPWSVTSGYKKISGSVPRAVPLVETVWKDNTRSGRWGFHGSGYPEFEDQRYPDLEEMIKSIGQGKLPKYDAARIAGMFITNSLYYVGDVVKDSVLLPLARRALQLSPSDPELMRLVLILNSKRKGIQAKNREAFDAMAGATLSGRSYSSLHTQDPWPLAQEYMKCRARTGSWPKGKHDCHPWGQLWFWSPNSHRSGKSNDPFFAVQIRSVVNRSSSTDELVKLGRDPSNFVPVEFEKLWSELEAKLLESKEVEELKFLLSALPVVHVDVASMFYMDQELPLVERCAFSLVAQSVAKNFPEALPWVQDARKALESPEKAPERLVGADGDIERLLKWIKGGKLESEVVFPPDDDPLDPEFHAWLEMMADHHACTADGSASFISKDESEDEEETTSETEGQLSLEEMAYQFEDEAAGQATSIQSCYEEWTKSAAAAAFKEYLDEQLR